MGLSQLRPQSVRFASPPNIPSSTTIDSASAEAQREEYARVQAEITRGEYKRARERAYIPERRHTCTGVDSRLANS